MPDLQGSHAVDVAAPRADCMALLLDVERYPEWYSTLDRVAALERDTDGTARAIRCEADAGPLGTIELTLSLRRPSAATLELDQIGGSGRITGVAMRWTLEEAGDGHTAAAYDFRADAAGVAARLALRAARPLVERDLVRGPPEALKRTLER